jgi:dehydrogenase/reductase SDR family member 7B
MVVVIPATAIYHYTHCTVKKEDFKNKVVLITGSTQGIGRKTAELLAQRGAIVVINSRNENKVIETVKAFEARGFSVFGSAGDVSNFDYCQQLRVDVITRFGKIDLLINNVSISATETHDSSSTNVLDEVTRINFFGSVYPTKVFLEDLIKAKGGILFISPLS